MIEKLSAPEIETDVLDPKTTEQTTGSYFQRLLVKQPEPIKKFAGDIAERFGVAGVVAKKVIDKIPTAVEKGTGLVTEKVKAVAGSAEEQFEKIFSKEKKEGMTKWAKKFQETLHVVQKGVGKDVSKSSGGVGEQLAQEARQWKN